MGKPVSELRPFTLERLGDNKYPNLKWMNRKRNILRLELPHKTKNLDPAYEQFSKEWRALKGLKYTYTKAKQALIRAFKVSDYFEEIKCTGTVLIYKVLDPEETIAKKKRKGKNVKKEYNPSSVESSGYGSGGERGNTPFSSDEEMDTETKNVQFVNNEQIGLARSPEHSSHLGGSLSHLWVNPNEIQVDPRNPIMPPGKQTHYGIEVDEKRNVVDEVSSAVLHKFEDLDVSSSGNTTVDDLMKLDIPPFEMDSSQANGDAELASSMRDGFLYDKIHPFPMN